MQFCIKVVLLNRSYSTNTKPDIESLNKMGKEMIHELKGKETNKETVDGTLNLQMVHVRFTTALIRLRKVNADILGWIGCFQIVAKCRFMQQRQPRKLSTKKRRFFPSLLFRKRSLDITSRISFKGFILLSFLLNIQILIMNLFFINQSTNSLSFFFPMNMENVM